MKAASSAFGKPREVICFAGLFCICKKTKNFSSEPSREDVDAACFATIAVHVNGRLLIGRWINKGEEACWLSDLPAIPVRAKPH